MSLTKKIFFICLAFFCITLLFFGIYTLVFRNPKKIEPVEEKKVSQATPQGTEIKINNEPIFALSDEAALAPTLNKDGSAVKYYAKSDGKVYQTGFNSKGKRVLSDRVLPQLSFVLWSPDKDKVLTKFSNNDTANLSFYDYNELKATALNAQITSVAWQNTSNRIFYLYATPNGGKATLNISNPDGTNWTKLAEVAYRDIAIAQIPQSGLVSFWNKPDAFFETLFKSIPIIGGEEKTLLKGLFGADYLWNNNGSFALVSHSDAKGGTKIQLSLVNSNGGELRNLNFPTLASKCVWLKNNNSAFCAMPGRIPASAIMPNDYDQEKFHTADTFWKINTQTGEKTRIIELEKINGEYDATNLFLDTEEKILFFINRTDGKLYRIAL